MGAEAFADRARRELVATGEKPGKGALATAGQLTAREAQVARMAPTASPIRRSERACS